MVLACLALVLAALQPPADRRLQAFVLLALLFALWRIGRALVAALVPDLPAPSSLVAAFTFAAAFGSVAATWLGHFGRLQPGAFLLVVAAGALLTLLVSSRAVEELPARSAFAPASAPDEGSPSASRPLVERWETIAALATVAAMVLGYVTEAMQRFARPLFGGPDDLSYHLTAVAVWQRWGDLRMVKFSMGDWGTAFYPILPEISAWVLLAPFRDSDVAARWAALPYALFALVAVAAIARRLGLGWRSALLSAAVYGLLNRVATLAFAAGNDHVTALCTLAALDGALACAERPRPGRFAYLGTALGLLVASKYLGIYNAITVLAVFVVAWIVQRRRRAAGDVAGGASSPVVGAAVLLATVVLVGGYTYLRNWVATDNPVYPQSVHVGGLEVFPGREELSLGGRKGGEQSEIDVWEFLTGVDNRFANFFPFTLLPAALFAPLVAAARRRWRDAALLALPVVFFLQFLYWTWDHRDVRYFFAGIALAAVAFAWLSERLGAAGAWLRTAMLAVVLYRYVRWLGARGEVELVVAVLLVAAAGAAWNRPRWRQVARAAAAPLLALLAVAAALALGYGVERYQRVKLAGSPAAQALERLTGARGTTVGYVGLNQPYLFFGSRLQNDVRVVPRSFNLGAELYRWGGRPERPFPRGTYSRWLGVMKIVGARYVVVVRSPHENPERAWMANHWERFRRVHVDSQIEIWHVLPADEVPRRELRRRDEDGRGPA